VKTGQGSQINSCKESFQFEIFAVLLPKEIFKDHIRSFKESGKSLSYPTGIRTSMNSSEKVCGKTLKSKILVWSFKIPLGHLWLLEIAKVDLLVWQVFKDLQRIAHCKNVRGLGRVFYIDDRLKI